MKMKSVALLVPSISAKNGKLALIEDRLAILSFRIFQKQKFVKLVEPSATTDKSLPLFVF